jgi:hypothetical protein
MATDIVQSLFGVTPDMYQRQQDALAEERAIKFAGMDPMAQATYGIYRGAGQLGGALGRALGGEDPELARISLRQQVARDIDYTDPESVQAGIQRLAPLDPQGAMMLNQEYRKALESGALVRQREAAAQASEAAAKRERQQAIPADILKAREIGQLRQRRDLLATTGAEAGQIAILDAQIAELTQNKPMVVSKGSTVVDARGNVIYQGPDAEKYSAFARELIDAGLTPGTEPFQKRMLEYVGNKAKGAAKGTGNVTIGNISVDTGAAAKAAGKVIGENLANVESQYSLQTAFKDAIDLIDKGIYGGAYGPEQQFVAKFTGIGNKNKVENTEVFLANVGEIVIPRLQQFGGNDSNEELKYLQKVVAGDQRLEPAAMRRILQSAEKKVQNNIARLLKQAEAGKTGAELPTAPAQAAPAAPIPTKRFNPQTGKIETIGG